MIVVLIYYSGICGTKFSKKCKFFKKPEVIGFDAGPSRYEKRPATCLFLEETDIREILAIVVAAGS